MWSVDDHHRVLGGKGCVCKANCKTIQAQQHARASAVSKQPCSKCCWQAFDLTLQISRKRLDVIDAVLVPIWSLDLVTPTQYVFCYCWHILPFAGQLGVLYIRSLILRSLKASPEMPCFHILHGLSCFHYPSWMVTEP